MSELPDTLEHWLKTIKKTQCFKESFKVVAPTCYGQCLHTVDQLVHDLNEIFKGSTVYDATGTWWDSEKRDFDTEPVKVIEIAHKCASKDVARRFAKAVAQYGVKAEQKSLLINHGSQFYIARSPQIVKAFVKEMRRAGEKW